MRTEIPCVCMGDDHQFLFSGESHLLVPCVERSGEHHIYCDESVLLEMALEFRSSFSPSTNMNVSVQSRNNHL